MKQYKNYKQTGIEWIGKIPSEWDIKRIKFVSSINQESLSNSLDPKTEIEYLDIGGLDENGNIIETNQYKFSDAPSRARRKVKSGDVIISTVRTYLKAITSISKEHSNLIVSTGYCVISPEDEIDSDYFGQLVRSENFIDEIISLSRGVSYPSTNASDIANIVIPIPSLEEQLKISQLIQWKIEKINSLITKNNQLIKLLEEKKQATINQAVTKGLDPNVRMKDSGIEWIGKIPVHWELKKLKYSLFLLTAKSDGSNKIALENIESKTGKYIFTDTEFQGDGIAFNIGDILFGKLRPYLAKVWEAEFKGNAVGDFFVLRPNERNNAKFRKYQILSNKVIRVLDGSTFGAKMPRVSWDFMGNLKLPEPPLEEQTKIGMYLDKAIGKIDLTIEKTKSQNILLQEYRHALISNAVTGKIDVRDEPIPEKFIKDQTL